MTTEPERAGSIYDLGYRSYGGTRLGRRHAVRTVYVESLRSAFGLGRRASSKVIPVILLVIVLLPAAVHLGIAAASRQQMDIVKPEDYSSFVEVILALFVAAQAPELAGRDQRNRTLSLYFSRAIERRDYALAKLGALVSAMLVLTLVPQAVLFVGNAFTTNDALEYLREDAANVPRVLASSVLVSGLCASVALAIASRTPRRAYATGGIIAIFVGSAAIGGILDATVGRYGIMVSLFDLMTGATYWIFSAEHEYEVATELMFAAVVGVTAISVGLILRRYERIPA
ncbi:MAG: hypothetical protein HUU14_06950 [Dehalococcoidia bacterium]|nr:hypothetical protein [Chloroflexi bacterium CFX7]MCK6563834.1 hypothetical protein [Dehalococcoidia bacterium]NUQ55603.1 hypothetical protein [Dehalococcoidia bacterium]RIL04361.1 MAG: hypothetical protein DCC78_01940 [bacterium]